jgi:hypothetical protein
MIPQPFVKGSGERVFFGRYEYVSGADIIFDFGNSTCTSAFNSSHIVYNVGSANVTGSLIPYNNPGPFYPTLEATNGGTMVTRALASLSNYLQWDWKSTQEQTTITISKLNGTQLNPWNSKVPLAAGASSIAITNSGNTVVTGSANLFVDMYDSGNTLNSFIFNTTLNVDVSNNRNGYNMVSVEANASTTHNLYINQTLSATDTTNIPRTTSSTQTTNFGVSSNMRIIAFLQYPFLLTPKQIRQTYKVFSQSFFA